MPPSILLIDDNVLWSIVFEDVLQETHSDIKLYFSKLGLKRCSKAQAKIKTGIEIYSQLTEQGITPSLVLLDIRLDCENGLDVALEFQRLYPDVNICFFTFYMEDVVGKNLGIPVISKQLPSRTIIEAIGKAIKGEYIV